MPSKIHIKFDKPFFEDIEPEEKSSDELFGMLLMEAAGRKVFLNKYSEREINICARQMILNGYMRGTIFDYNRCVWSKPTKKGFFVLKVMEKCVEECCVMN
ncbi:MAG: hypothetical protein EPN82_15260 [Bacteroidetes bacterium]|nr:MAG: hypothetical protein EPN82_15260 [Bacteroidota bacterium]